MHLIFTGKNGSGKTTLLQEIKKFLIPLENSNKKTLSEIEKDIFEIQRSKSQTLDHRNNIIPGDSIIFRESNMQLERLQNQMLALGGTILQYSSSEDEIKNKIKEGKFILSYFDAKRYSRLSRPNGINKFDFVETALDKLGNAGQQFLQYIVNMKADRSFANDDNEIEIVKKIDTWFKNFENQLSYVFDVENLKLVFDRNSYNFNIVTDDTDKFDFHNLSDGYSAILNIVTELIMRMEKHDSKAYDLEGIVIIDEIETHLHIDLQKKILPFLIGFFPKIQFIVTTHSPFVLTSLSDAIICDLETRIITTDLIKYSYESIIENYFNVDQYSTEIKFKLEQFEKLLTKKTLALEEKIELKELREYFSKKQQYYSKELHAKLLELELLDLTKNSDK